MEGLRHPRIFAIPCRTVCSTVSVHPTNPSVVVMRRFTLFISFFVDNTKNKVSVNYHKYTIYIARIGSDGKTLRESAPCRDCHQTLKILGFRKIIYTTDTGIMNTRIHQIESLKCSWGRTSVQNNTQHLRKISHNNQKGHDGT